MGRQHPLHFFSLHTQHHFQTTRREGLSQELWGHGVLVPSAGPLAKGGAKATQEGPAAPQLFRRFKSAVTTLFASGILRKMKPQLLCQPATNRAESLSLQSPSKCSLCSTGRGCKPCCSGSCAMPCKAPCWLHVGDKQHSSNIAERQGQWCFPSLLCSPGNLH